MVNRGCRKPQPYKYAELAELVDALDSGSSVRLGLPGSSPGFRINPQGKKGASVEVVLFFCFWVESPIGSGVGRNREPDGGAASCAPLRIVL